MNGMPLVVAMRFNAYIRPVPTPMPANIRAGATRDGLARAGATVCGSLEEDGLTS